MRIVLLTGTRFVTVGFVLGWTLEFRTFGQFLDTKQGMSLSHVLDILHHPDERSLVQFSVSLGSVVSKMASEIKSEGT